MLKNLKNRLNENKGFSLVELIVVIAIMVILIALLVPNVVGYISKAQDSANLSAAKSIYNAVNTAVIDYKAQHGGYPDATQLKDTLTDSSVSNAEKLVVIPKGTAAAIGYDGAGNVWAVAVASASSTDNVKGTSAKNLQVYSPLASGNCLKKDAADAAGMPYITATDIDTLVGCISIAADGTWTAGSNAGTIPTTLTGATS